MDSAAILSSASNVAVVQLPGRHFPGSVIQGDSLSLLYTLACEIEDGVAESSDEELRGNAVELRELLEGRLRHYCRVLAEKGMPPLQPVPVWRSRESE